MFVFMSKVDFQINSKLLLEKGKSQCVTFGVSVCICLRERLKTTSGHKDKEIFFGGLDL